MHTALAWLTGFTTLVPTTAPPMLVAPPWEDPSLFAQLIISGIASGSLYAILALALVLIYRSTDVLNFSQGEMAMFATFMAWTFMTRMDFWPAFFLSLLVAAAIGACLERFVLRPVEEAPPLNSIVVTLGLFIIFNGLALRIWGSLPKGFGPFEAPIWTPFGTIDFFFAGAPVCAGDVCIGRLNVGILFVAFAIMLVLYVLFQRTTLGLAMRASAQNRTASRLVGIPVGNMLSIGWALSAAVGAIAGVLVAQNLGLTTATLFAVLIFAFASAVLGGLDSPVGAIVGGLIVGIVQNLGRYSPDSVGNIDLTLAFLVIVVVLMIKPTGLFGQAAVRRV